MPCDSHPVSVVYQQYKVHGMKIRLLIVFEEDPYHILKELSCMNIAFLGSELHEWGEWTDCPVSCGQGVRTRRRNCAASRGSTFEHCPEPLVESEVCSEGPQPCESIKDLEKRLLSSFF